MKTLSFSIVIVGGLLFCSSGRANITGVTLQSDSDGAIQNCPVYVWNGSASQWTAPISGDQYGQPAHIAGTIQTDSIGDPSLTLSSAIANDTAFTWTAYQVNVYMNNVFTISGGGVTLPGDWTTTTTQPVWNGTQYEGELLFASGTPIAVGGELDFAYTITFGNATSYSFTQEMIPVPEPGMFGFIAAGALVLGGILATSRRTKHS